MFLEGTGTAAVVASVSIFLFSLVHTTTQRLRPHGHSLTDSAPRLGLSSHLACGGEGSLKVPPRLFLSGRGWSWRGLGMARE